jgi:hypothetical protein
MIASKYYYIVKISGNILVTLCSHMHTSLLFYNYAVIFCAVFTMPKRSMNLELYIMVTCLVL